MSFMKRRSFFAFLLLLAGSCLAQDKAADKPTLLCIGDSITQGGPTFVGYRQVLIPELRKRGIPFECVGPLRDETSAHAGYGGKNTAYLKGISQEIYQKYPADIVLIHSGHNSFSKDKPVPGILADTEAIIRNIHTINPKAKVLLAQVIPSGKLPKYDYIPDLNRQLPELAKRLNKEGVSVTIVNLEAGFDWRSDTVADQVHPNAAGARKMADQWLQALLPLLEATR